MFKPRKSELEILTRLYKNSWSSEHLGDLVRERIDEIEKYLKDTNN